MAQLPDAGGPTTSYSDPFYDRLESVAQRITRRLGLVVVGLVIAVVVAVLVHGWMHDNPTAASADAYLTIATKRDEAQRAHDPVKVAAAAKDFESLAANADIKAFFRARALIELVQHDLDRGDAAGAKAHAAKAKDLAAQAADDDLQLAADLSAAAADLQAGDLPAAEKAYARVESAARVTYPDRQIAAIQGGAKAIELQGRLDDAIAKLEPLVNRTDTSAGPLLKLAKQQYWRLKRMQATGVKPDAPKADAPSAVPPVAAPPALIAAPPAAPAAPTPAPSANPEGTK